MKNRLLHFILVICTAVLLSACGEEPCKRDCDDDGKHCKKDCGGKQFQCIEADDWGYPKVWIPADKEGIVEYFKGVIDYEDDATEQERQDLQDEVAEGVITGNYPDQSAKAIDSKLVLIDPDNIPLVITVGDTNQWTSWFGGEINTTSDGNKDPYGWDGGQEVANLECIYQVTNGTPPSPDDASSGVSVFRDDLSPAVLWSDRTDENNLQLNKRLFYIGEDNKFYVLNDKDDLAKRNSSDLSNFTVSENIALYANDVSPCYFRYGMGLYIGLASNNKIVDPTDDDVIFTYHIPDSKIAGTPSDPDFEYSSSLYTQSYEDETEAYTQIDEEASANTINRGLDGYLVRGYASDELPGSMADDRLFFKIVDNYYDDNSGGYQVKIKEGTRPAEGGPLETVTNFIIDPVKSIMKTLYEGIVANEEFVAFVRALLLLYMVFYGYKWLMGIGSAADLRKDAVIRMFKIGIITILIGPDSWNFFYNTLFAAFTEGVIDISGLLMSPFSDYDPQEPWYSMDSLLAKFFSPETYAKINSTLFSNFPAGILYIIILYLCIAIFVLSLLKAVVLYLVTFIGMAILIALAPIFIVMMLFKETKSLLEEWWAQMITFSVQLLLLMTALGMFSTLITTYMERTLGYKVCWNVYADFDFLGVNEDISVDFHLADFRFWMPDISTNMANIWMDVDDDGVKTLNPPEMAFRYVDLPYFDPIFDRDEIAKYMTGENFLEITDLFVFLLVILLMLAFMDFIETLASRLKGGSPVASSGTAMAAASNLFNSVAASAAQAINFAGNRVLKPIADPIGQLIQRKAAQSRAEAKAKRKAIKDAATKDSGGAGKSMKRVNESQNLGNTLAKRGAAKATTDGIIEDSGMLPTQTNKPATSNITPSNSSANQQPIQEPPMVDLNDVGAKELYGTTIGGGVLQELDKTTNRAREEAKGTREREEREREERETREREARERKDNHLKETRKRKFDQLEQDLERVERGLKRQKSDVSSLSDTELSERMDDFMKSKEYNLRLSEGEKAVFEANLRALNDKIDAGDGVNNSHDLLGTEVSNNTTNHGSHHSQTPSEQSVNNNAPAIPLETVKQALDRQDDAARREREERDREKGREKELREREEKLKLERAKAKDVLNAKIYSLELEMLYAENDKKGELLKEIGRLKSERDALK